MDAATIAILGTLATGIVLEVVRRFLVSGDDKRAGRKDLRDEIQELWARIDKQDSLIAAKDTKIAELEASISNLMQWKQSYTALSLERDYLNRRIKEMEGHIVILERKVLDLQNANNPQ